MAGEGEIIDAFGRYDALQQSHTYVPKSTTYLLLLINSRYSPVLSLIHTTHLLEPIRTCLSLCYIASVALCSLTCTPVPLLEVNVRFCLISVVGSRFSMASKLCRRRTTAKPADVSANCWPMHNYTEQLAKGQGLGMETPTLGPPLKGKNSQPAFLPIHRSGLNSSASWPHKSLFRCMA